MVYDVMRFGREVMQIEPGTKVEIDSPQYKFIEKQATKFNDLRMQAVASGPKAPPQFYTMTNQEGRAIDVLIKPSGDIQIIEPKIQNTRQGLMTLVNPTNAVPMVNPQTGEALEGYVAADSMYGEQPVVGAQPAATPAATPTAAMKPYSMTNAEGTAMTFSNPYDVRAALRRGELTQDEAVAATLHFRRP